MATVAEEFLVRLGFEVNQDQLSKFQHTSATVTKGLRGVGGAALAVGMALALGIENAAKNTQKLYHEANKIGTNITNLKAAEETFQRFGGSAQDAHTALNALAQRMKTIPNFSGFLEQNLGVKTIDKTTGKMRDMNDILEDVIKALQKMPQEERVVTAQFLGLDSVMDTIMQKGFVQELDKQREIMGKLGGAMNDNTDKARKFQNSLKDIGSTLNTSFQSEFLEILNITGADEWLADFSNRLRSVLPDFFAELNRYLKAWKDGKLWETIGSDIATKLGKNAEEGWANATDEELEQMAEAGEGDLATLKQIRADAQSRMASRKGGAKKPEVAKSTPAPTDAPLQQKAAKEQGKKQDQANDLLKKIEENTRPTEDIDPGLKEQAIEKTRQAISGGKMDAGAGKGTKGISKSTDAFYQMMRNFVKEKYGDEYDLEITSGYRSFAEQQALYNQGRDGKGGKIVTYAKPGQSKHNTGQAFDFYLTKGGKRVPGFYQDKDTQREIGLYAKSLGGKWGGIKSEGGDFSFNDSTHVQFDNAMTIEDERKLEEKRKKLKAPAPAKPGQAKGASSPVASVDPNWVNPTSEDVKKTLAGTLAAYGFTVKPSAPPANGKNVSVIVNQNNNFPNATNAGEIQHGLNLAVDSNSQILSRAVGSQGVV